MRSAVNQLSWVERLYPSNMAKGVAGSLDSLSDWLKTSNKPQPSPNPSSPPSRSSFSSNDRYTFILCRKSKVNSIDIVWCQSFRRTKLNARTVRKCMRKQKVGSIISDRYTFILCRKSKVNSIDIVWCQSFRRTKLNARTVRKCMRKQKVGSIISGGEHKVCTCIFNHFFFFASCLTFCPISWSLPPQTSYHLPPPKNTTSLFHPFV